MRCASQYLLTTTLSRTRAVAKGGSGGRAPSKPELPPPVFAEQRHKAQLSQFCLRRFPLLPPTFFHDVVFIQVYINFAHYSVCQKFSVIQKNVKMHFRPGLSSWPRWGSSRRSPDLLVGQGGDILPQTSPTLSVYGASILAASVLPTRRLDLRAPPPLKPCVPPLL